MTASKFTFGIVGYGAQAQAWLPSFREAGLAPTLFLRAEGDSWKRAQAANEQPQDVRALEAFVGEAQLKGRVPTLALLISDGEVSGFYQAHLAQLAGPLALILGHGFAMVSDLAKAPRVRSREHEVLLFAPKAIGAKLREGVRQGAHTLAAAVASTAGLGRGDARLQTVAEALKFLPENLIETDFATETRGDWMSEQGILCGGLLTLLESTMLEMRALGVPERLIREECLTELELIAGVLKHKTPSQFLSAISDAAKAGLVEGRVHLREKPIPQALGDMRADIERGHFQARLERGEWKSLAERYRAEIAREGIESIWKAGEA